MRSSTPTCNLVSPSTGYGGKMLLLQPQYPIAKKEHETFSHIENPSTKRAKTGENFVHNQRMPASLNKVTSGNLETRVTGPSQYTYGKFCPFIHGARYNQKQLTGAWNEEYRLVDELQYCRMFYYKKTCKYEDRCRYLHVNPEKVKEGFSPFNDRSVISIRTAGPSGDNRSGSGPCEQKKFFKSRSFCDRVNLKPVMQKTKLCRKWEMTGSCPYGKMCYFAHGQAELQNRGSHRGLESRIVPMNISNTVSTLNDQIGTTFKQQVQGMKCIVKWKEFGKINGIYADWIEDMPIQIK